MNDLNDVCECGEIRERHGAYSYHCFDCPCGYFHMCELDKNLWSIVTATEVICMSKTYQQCVMLIDQQNLNHNEATIVTNEAAARMQQNKIDSMKQL